MRLRVLIVVCSLFCAFAQERVVAQVAGVDVLDYEFRIAVDDASDRIEGETLITVRFDRAGVERLTLDLVTAAGPREPGMQVAGVRENDRTIRFEHAADRLVLHLSSPSQAAEERRFSISYGGIPVDGLIIAKNRHGNRTFFGDNWPNRARNWLPTIDHPSDKATCAFVITAPNHYQVIANGRLVEETDLPGERRRTTWRTDAPLPTKVMVFGAARFAVRYEGEVADVPVQTWVYPEDRDDGFYDFAVAMDMLRYFDNRIGSFPYAKLANVQSKTRYGGMENAGAIFYNENAITGERSNESTVAHEIAHQWFGDSVTEADWPHIWLSEGFATYFAELYLEHAYGRSRLVADMAEAREAVIRFFRRSPTPLVDTRTDDPNQLLNTNSYQKGGWVLHMLRGLIGDDAFWIGIRSYYATHRDANATSDDLRQAMEQAAGQELGWFFDQWLYRPGQPKLRVTHGYDAANKQLTVTVAQRQAGAPFRFPLDLDLVTGGDVRRERVLVDQAEHTFRFELDRPITELVVDPDVALLMELDPAR
ncbi:MAG: M1 family aminopeptidase [Rhodothermales bacterium]